MPHSHWADPSCFRPRWEPCQDIPPSSSVLCHAAYKTYTMPEASACSLPPTPSHPFLQVALHRSPRCNVPGSGTLPLVPWLRPPELLVSMVSSLPCSLWSLFSGRSSSRDGTPMPLCFVTTSTTSARAAWRSPTIDRRVGTGGITLPSPLPRHGNIHPQPGARANGHRAVRFATPLLPPPAVQLAAEELGVPLHPSPTTVLLPQQLWSPTGMTL